MQLMVSGEGLTTSEGRRGNLYVKCAAETFVFAGCNSVAMLAFLEGGSRSLAIVLERLLTVQLPRGHGHPL
jgi:hypothetical protein